MEPKTQTTQTERRFQLGDFFPSVWMSALIMAGTFVPTIFGMAASLQMGALIATCACFLIIPLVGAAQHFDSFFDTVFDIGKTASAILGTAYVVESSMLPAGSALDMTISLKTSFLTLGPWFIIAFWMLSSVFALRRIRSRKTLGDALEKAEKCAEESLAHSRETIRLAEDALRKSDEILNPGKTDSATSA